MRVDNIDHLRRREELTRTPIISRPERPGVDTRKSSCELNLFPPVAPNLGDYG